MQDFSAPIIQQPRLVLVLPFAIMVITLVAANVVWYLTRAVGAPTVVSAVAAMLVFVAGIALAISSSVGAQGTITIADGQLEVDGRWRAARLVPLAGAETRTVVWRRGGVTHLVVGVILTVRGADGSSVTIGSSDPGLADVLTARGIESTTIPPRAAVAPAHFRQLLDALGVVTGAEGAS